MQCGWVDSTVLHFYIMPTLLDWYTPKALAWCINALLASYSPKAAFVHHHDDKGHDALKALCGPRWLMFLCVRERGLFVTNQCCILLVLEHHYCYCVLYRAAPSTVSFTLVLYPLLNAPSLLLTDGSYTANGDSKTGSKAPKSPPLERKQSRFAALGRIFKPWKWKRRKKPSEKIEAKAVGE